MSALGHKEILVYDNDGPLDMQNGKSRSHSFLSIYALQQISQNLVICFKQHLLCEL